MDRGQFRGVKKESREMSGEYYVPMYLTGALIGAVCALAAILLSLGALQKRGRKLIARLMKAKWFLSVKTTAVLLFGLATGCYGLWAYGSLSFEYARFMMLVTCLFSAALTDLRHRQIHMDSMLAFAVVGILHRLMFGGILGVTTGLTGALAGAGILGIPYLLRKDSVGAGDILLLAVAGIYIGAMAVIVLLVRALLILSAVCIIQLLRKKVTRSSEMPLAPFLLLGALL